MEHDFQFDAIKIVLSIFPPMTSPFSCQLKCLSSIYPPRSSLYVILLLINPPNNKEIAISSLCERQLSLISFNKDHIQTSSDTDELKYSHLLNIYNKGGHIEPDVIFLCASRAFYVTRKKIFLYN